MSILPQSIQWDLLVRVFYVHRPPKTVKVVCRVVLALSTAMGLMASKVKTEVETKVKSDGPNRGRGGRGEREERGGNNIDQLNSDI